MSLGNSPSRPGQIGQTSVSGGGLSQSKPTQQPKTNFHPKPAKARVNFDSIKEETQQDSTGPS